METSSTRARKDLPGAQSKRVLWGQRGRVPQEAGVSIHSTQALGQGPLLLGPGLGWCKWGLILLGTFISVGTPLQRSEMDHRQPGRAFFFFQRGSVCTNLLHAARSLGGTSESPGFSSPARLPHPAKAEKFFPDLPQVPRTASAGPKERQDSQCDALKVLLSAQGRSETGWGSSCPGTSGGECRPPSTQEAEALHGDKMAFSGLKVVQDGLRPATRAGPLLSLGYTHKIGGAVAQAELSIF